MSTQKQRYSYLDPIRTVPYDEPNFHTYSRGGHSGRYPWPKEVYKERLMAIIDSLLYLCSIHRLDTTKSLEILKDSITVSQNEFGSELDHIMIRINTLLYLQSTGKLCSTEALTIFKTMMEDYYDKED